MNSFLAIGELRDLQEADVPVMLALNNAHSKETSLLDDAALTSLLAQCVYARGVGRGEVALLLALDQAAAYENPNFEWFKERRERFVYIDRVIVAAAARGKGLAGRLYRDLFAKAAAMGHRCVVCEVNVEPPNPASDAFHKSMGFEVIGEATIYGGKKIVRYFEKKLD